MKKILLTLALSISLCSIASAAFLFDPALKWNTIETPHFLIHFHQGEEELAKEAAVIAEEAHKNISALLNFELESKTPIILSDNLDNGNGFAGYPESTIYISARPSLISEIASKHENWLALVIPHEYTHIVQMGMVKGWPAKLKKIFGNIILPNALMPGFLIEGIATYAETKFTSGGRGKESITDMILRCAILEDKFNSIDQANGFLNSWPAGYVHYLYGVKFLEYLAEKYGEEKLIEFQQRYSERIVPFRLQTTAQEVFGKNWDGLWQDWHNYLKEKYKKEIEKLLARRSHESALADEGVGGRNKEITRAERLTESNYFSGNARFSPDNRHIVYHSYTPDEHPALKIMGRDGTQNQTLVKIESSSMLDNFSFSPLGDQIVFSQNDYKDTFSQYSDLYLYDLIERKVKRITQSKRARDPAWSPDGKTIVFAQQNLGSSDLTLYNTTDQGAAPLSRNYGQTQYFNPCFNPTSDKIAFVIKDGSFQDIAVMNTADGEIKRITSDIATDVQPAFSPDNKYLFFSSDRSGIFNIYAFELSAEKLYQVTNVIGGAFSPQIAKDGQTLLFTGYSANGFDVNVTKIDSAEFISVEIEGIRGDQKAVEGDKDRPPDLSGGQNETQLKITDYQPWRSIWPKFWLPYFTFDERGLQTGFFTFGNDDIYQHRYLLATGLTNRLSYDFQYSYDGLYPTLTLDLSDTSQNYALNGADKTYWEHSQKLAAYSLWQFKDKESNKKITAGFQQENLSALNAVAGTSAPSQGRLSGPFVSMSYNDSHFYGRSISRTDGREVFFAYYFNDKTLGSDFNLKKYVLSYNEYLGLPLKHQVLNFSFLLGGSEGDVLTQRTFKIGGSYNAHALRGYSLGVQRGQKLGIIRSEYRFPVYNIERGLSVYPLFFQQLHAALFLDAGSAWDNNFNKDEVKVGIGAELRLDVDVPLFYPTFKLGAAQGLSPEGQTQVYFTYNLSF